MADEFLASAYDYAMHTFNAEMTEAQAEFARAKVDYDAAAAAEASRRMADVRVRAGEYERMAHEHVAAMAAAPKPNRYGLTADQQEAARVTGVDEETYARGVVELAHRKAIGMYPDGRT